MLKKFAVSVLTIGLLTFGAGPVLGEPDAAKLDELRGLYQQKYELQVKILDKRVEAGILEKAKADHIKEKMEQHHKVIQEDMANGKYEFGNKHKRHSECKKPQTAPDTKSSPSTK